LIPHSISESEESEYNGIGYVGYYMMALRTSLGDFAFDGYNEAGSIVITFRWFIWITSVMILQVILLNLFIAMIAETHEKVMQRLQATGYKVKVEMIAERELRFSEEDFKNEEYFPKYLIIRNPVA
jgi:hypothetical protein